MWISQHGCLRMFYKCNSRLKVLGRSVRLPWTPCSPGSAWSGRPSSALSLRFFFISELWWVILCLLFRCCEKTSQQDWRHSAQSGHSPASWKPPHHISEFSPGSGTSQATLYCIDQLQDQLVLQIASRGSSGGRSPSFGRFWHWGFRHFVQCLV